MRLFKILALKKFETNNNKDVEVINNKLLK